MKRNLLRFVLCTFVLSLSIGTITASTPVLSLPMEMDEDAQVKETVKNKSFTVRGKHADNVEGVVGKALRLDGYSSFVQIPMSNYQSQIGNQFTVSFWTICQTYPMMVMDVADNQESAIISCLDDTNKKGFAFILYSQGKYGFSCYINGEKKTLSPAALFPKQQWVHLAATVDAVSGAIAFYQNGQQVASAYAKGTVNTASSNLYIGKSTVDTKSGQFYLNTYNGAIDELNIYNEALTAEEVNSQFTPHNSQFTIINSLNIPASHWNADITRPRHHAMPASNWMNESHGMTYANGKYHLFFQKNGNGPYMSRLHWGHVSSEDLCNWTEEPIAIAPDKAYDLKGCWSGCVFTDQSITHGEPWILYTGVNNARASISIATPVDDALTVWNKAATNPVISGTPEGYSADFRDPYFFRNGENAYCIVGTSRNGVASTSLHRYNTTTKVFDYTGVPFFTGSNISQCGTFFEMPNITPMGDNRWLFTATPLGTTLGVRTIYYVGTINEDGTFATTQSAPKTVELPALARDGYGLLSPTICQIDGKTIALGIVPDKLSSSQNFNAGWAHTLSLPREWSIDAQGELVQKPYTGLQALRSETAISLDAQTIHGDLSLNPVSGFEVEVEAAFTVGADPFGIKILQSDNGTACKVFFNPQTNQFTIDCSSIARKANDEGVFNGVYSSGLPASVGEGQTMKIHLFFDHSVLDVFINDRWATSVRVFPTSSSATGVSVFADGEAELQSVSAWTMKNDDAPQGITPFPTFSPETARKEFHNGMLYIHRNNKVYTINGQMVQ